LPCRTRHDFRGVSHYRFSALISKSRHDSICAPPRYVDRFYGVSPALQKNSFTPFVFRPIRLQLPASLDDLQAVQNAFALR
jgi:hypothetical protein